jgi:hypothetical protein
LNRSVSTKNTLSLNRKAGWMSEVRWARLDRKLYKDEYLNTPLYAISRPYTLRCSLASVVVPEKLGERGAVSYSMSKSNLVVLCRWPNWEQACKHSRGLPSTRTLEATRQDNGSSESHFVANTSIPMKSGQISLCLDNIRYVCCVLL